MRAGVAHGPACGKHSWNRGVADMTILSRGTRAGPPAHNAEMPRSDETGHWLAAGKTAGKAPRVSGATKVRAAEDGTSHEKRMRERTPPVKVAFRPRARESEHEQKHPHPHGGLRGRGRGRGPRTAHKGEDRGRGRRTRTKDEDEDAHDSRRRGRARPRSRRRSSPSRVPDWGAAPRQRRSRIWGEPTTLADKGPA